MKLIFCLILSTIVITQDLHDFEKGKQFFADSQWEEAKKYFEKFLKKNPNHTASLEYMGDIFGQKKNWDSAIYYYKKIKIQNPNNADFHYKYGGVLGMKAKETNKFKALGMLDEVEASFLKAVQLDSKHVDARLALVILYMELPGIIGGSESKARKYAEQIQNISVAEGSLAFGTIEEYNKNYLRAEQLYLKAHQALANEKSFQKLYQLYLTKMKDLDKAKKLKSSFEKQ
jgi:hypothetical protein